LASRGAADGSSSSRRDRHDAGQATGQGAECVHPRLASTVALFRPAFVHHHRLAGQAQHAPAGFPPLKRRAFLSISAAILVMPGAAGVWSQGQIAVLPSFS